MFNIQKEIVTKTIYLKGCKNFQIIILQDESLCFGQLKSDGKNRGIKSEDCVILHYRHCLKKFVDWLLLIYSNPEDSAESVFQCLSTKSLGKIFFVSQNKNFILLF